MEGGSGGGDYLSLTTARVCLHFETEQFDVRVDTDVSSSSDYFVESITLSVEKELYDSRSGGY